MHTCCGCVCVCLVLQVHLHEQAGLVYVDSDGGCVTAWLSPSGTPLGLQVKAAGGVVLDPALKVCGTTVAHDACQWVSMHGDGMDIRSSATKTLCSNSESQKCDLTMLGHTAQWPFDAPDASPTCALSVCGRLWQLLCVH